MHISAIYSKYLVTPNLAEHMLRVTKLIKVIQEHWIGEKLDWEELILTGLFHDIGNIVKLLFGWNAERHKQKI